MMKITKPRKICKHCGKVEEYEEQEYFCDWCYKKIDTTGGESMDMLDITIFHEDYEKEADYYCFCSWRCTIEKVKTIKCDNYIPLPILVYHETKPGLNAKDFFDLLK